MGFPYYKINLTAYAVALAFFAYCAASSTSVLKKVRNESVLSLSEAVSVIDKEKRKLGIESKIILQIATYDELLPAAYAHCLSYGEGGNIIVVNKSQLKKTTLKHEMSHAKRECTLKGGKTLEETLRIIQQSRRKSPRMPAIVLPFLPSTWLNLIEEARADTYAAFGLDL